MRPNKFYWVLIDFHASSGILMGSYVSLLVFMRPYAFLWVLMGPYKS